MEILLAFIIVTAIIICGFIWLLKSSSNQGSSLGVDWKAFKEAVDQNNISEVIRIDQDLCHNIHLTKEQSDQISAYTEKNISTFPELEKLRIAVMNKHVKWHRRAPSWDS